MTILSSVRKREPRRLREASGSSVDDFGYQRKRLKRARSKLFKKQQLCKVVKVSLVGDGKDGAKTLEVDVLRSHFVMARHAEVPRRGYCYIGILVCDVEQRSLGRLRLGIDEVHDDTLVLAYYSRMRFRDKVSH